jgi:hypothetical protein
MASDTVDGPEAQAKDPFAGLTQPMAWWCYRYEGPSVRDSEMRDNSRAVPPLRLDHWPHKPSSMRVHTASSAEHALDWLAGQVDDYAPRMVPADPGRHARLLSHVEGYRSDANRGFIRHARVVHWQHALPGGNVVVWAIVPDTSPDLKRRSP